jgi:signal transduction histidine kinase/DNA-binding NarL/FixJ family response regulator
MFRQRTRLLVALVVASMLTVFAVATVSVYEFYRARSVETRIGAWRDPASNQVTGFERQFLQVRGELSTWLAAPTAQRLADLRLRWEVLVSRVNLLHESASLESVRSKDEYRTLMPKLLALVASGDRMLARNPPDAREAAELLEQLHTLAPEVQAQSGAVFALTTRLVEDQFEALSRETLTIFALAALQLVVMGVAVHSIWTRDRQQLQAQEKLEALARELEESRVAAEAAARSKSQFLANMSHELRTPFQGVLGMMQLLEETPLTDGQTELVRTARESAKHLLAVLNGILDISAIEAGKVVLHPVDLDLRRMCEEVSELMRVQAAERGLALSMEVDDDVPAWVTGDVTRIRQVLFNLLSNAIKFTRQGEVRLAVSAAPLPDDSCLLQFEVTDTGIGLDEETLSRLFTRFETGDTGLSRRFGGAGLGLEISRNLARLMGGDLVGMPRHKVRGSRFVFTLPTHAAQAQSPAPAPVPAHALGAGRKLRLLVADDHPINQRYLSLVLANLGHEGEVCDNGEEAVELVQVERYDAVLMDIHMPVMDGLAATRAIRALGGRYADLPILALSADVLPESRERALQAGATRFLAKPLQIQDLAAALAAVAGVTAPAAVSQRLLDMAATLPADKLRELLDAFFEDEAGALRELREAMAGGDATQVREAAHKFKGSARMLGLGEIAAVAEAVEGWARAGLPARERHALGERLTDALVQGRRAVREITQPMPLAA